MKIRDVPEPLVGDYVLIETTAHEVYERHIDGWYLTSNEESDWTVVPRTWEEITRAANFVWVIPATPTAER